MTYVLDVLYSKGLETLWHMIITAYIAGGYHCLGNTSQKYYWIALYMFVMFVYDAACWLVTNTLIVPWFKDCFIGHCKYIVKSEIHCLSCKIKYLLSRINYLLSRRGL